MKIYKVSRRQGGSLIEEIIEGVYDVRETKEFLKFVDEKGITLYAIAICEVISYRLLTPEVDSE